MNLFSAHGPLRVALLAAAALLFEAGASVAQTPQPAAEAPLCVYLDRSYSEGATICPQARFMLICSAEGAKLVWKAVADRSLADRCLRPTIATEDPVPPVRRRIARSLPSPASAPSPTAGTSAKCFAFNGRRYCE